MWSWRIRKLFKIRSPAVPVIWKQNQPVSYDNKGAAGVLTSKGWKRRRYKGMTIGSMREACIDAGYTVEDTWGKLLARRGDVSLFVSGTSTNGRENPFMLSHYFGRGNGSQCLLQGSVEAVPEALFKRAISI